MDLADQKVVVIGGTSGVGLAVAEAAGYAGASLVVASSNAEHVTSAVDKLPKGTRGYQLDVRDEAGVKNFFDTVGEFDHLVFTAGDYLVFKPLGEITLAVARECFEVRYWGAFTAAKYGAPRVRQGGSFVFTSGIITVRPVAGIAAAASATGAVEALTRQLAVELAPIRVNAVRLGPVGRKPQPGEEAHQAELYRTISAKLLTKRMGRPAEAAGAYLYLMENGFSTGTLLGLDGGYLLV
jgi:NAD(P)-dependent dehydrogenase (short-subunit alcohol dehydrogenase family)